MFAEEDNSEYKEEDGLEDIKEWTGMKSNEAVRITEARHR